MKLLVIFNPKAASGRAREKLPAIRAALSSHDIRHEVLVSEAPGGAMELAANVRLADYDGVLAAGGDGTLFEVLNGLYRQARESRIPLGVIPLGTGNAFCKDIGLEPGDIRAAVDLVARNRLRPVDVARVTTASEHYHFLNIVGMGFAVDAGLTAVRFKRLGKMAYTLGTLWQTLKLGSYPLRIRIDGRLVEQDNVFVEISNTRYTGTSFLMAPSACMDDGLLDVTLLRTLPRLRLLRLFPSIFSGRHVNYDDVSVFQGKVIRIESPAGLPLAADGEFRGESPAEIVCLHRDLLFYGP